MAAKSKAELVKLFENEFSKLEKTLSTISEENALILHPEDGITIKDTIAHRTHWLGLFFVWYEGEKAGEEVQTPAPGVKWNQLKTYNAHVREQWSETSWPEVLRAFHAAHAKLLEAVNALSDKELYTPHLYRWTNNWTLGRWAEANGPSHYRSANKYIRQILRAIEH